MEVIDAVIKIGGSIMVNPKNLRNVCGEIARLARKGYKVVIVPGGGVLADIVRRLFIEYDLSNNLAHWMAIAAMDANGILISEIDKVFIIVTSVEGCREALKDKQIPIFCTYQLLKKDNHLPPSWDVTSDSISLYISHVLKARYNVLVKSVDGIYRDSDSKDVICKILASKLIKMRSSTCVDVYMPKLLIKYKRDTHIVSGLYPERIEKVLNRQRVVGTVISS